MYVSWYIESECLQIIRQGIEAAVGIYRNVCARLIDHAIGQQEYFHTKFLGDHVFTHIITHHEAFCSIP